MAAEFTLAEESKSFENSDKTPACGRLSVTGHTSPLPFRTTSHPQPVIFQMNARICRIPKSIQSRGNDIDFYGLILGEPVFTGQLIESLAGSLADAGFLGSLWF